MPKTATLPPVRAVLGLLVVGAHAVFRRAVAATLGQDAARWTAVLTACQFHFLFYASRPLPNTFALVLGGVAAPRRATRAAPLHTNAALVTQWRRVQQGGLGRATVLLALAAWLRQQHAVLISLLAAATVIVRGELVLLAGPILLLEWLSGRVTLRRGILWGVTAGLASLGAVRARGAWPVSELALTPNASWAPALLPCMASSVDGCIRLDALGTLAVARGGGPLLQRRAKQEPRMGRTGCVRGPRGWSRWLTRACVHTCMCGWRDGGTLAHI